MLILKLNYPAMQPETLRLYHQELCDMARDLMTSAERQEYRAVRARVAMLVAFQR